MSNLTLNNFKRSNDWLKSIVESGKLSEGESNSISEQIDLNERIIEQEENK